MNEAIGTIIILLGQAIALVMRLWPSGGINPYIPRVVWALNFVGILAGWAQKLLEAIGPVALMQSPSGHFGAIAWGGIIDVLKVGLAAFAAAVLTAITKKVYEEGTKPTLPPKLLAAGKA